MVIPLIYIYFADKIIKMEMHSCFICIGSNTYSEKNMELARKELQRFFPDIVFGKEVETKPLLFRKNLTPFHNQTGRFHSSQSSEEIKRTCKQIERQAGRMPEDKSKEIVKLDIDLVQYDDFILKPEDMQRPYLKG